MYDLSPMLLEINSSPSLRIDGEIEVAPGVPESIPSPKDEEVKIPLIRDTLLLVAPRKKVKYLERFVSCFSFPPCLFRHMLQLKYCSVMLF
ncbi:hypothetical protein DPMN_037398 [Dreissena polymorpha]|uniref:Uncharacterized protein n=1 Tax=Dreissena polymorpha TaxID=45954 RepID=A0A9D4RMA5_DREPO|nr:hypothetical protein DPMN_037398 [Dreissena polymorpha]